MIAKATDKVLKKGKSKAARMKEMGLGQDDYAYPELAEMFEDVMKAINKYNGKVPMPAAIGVLKLVQDEIAR